jgi:hypothetical protein
MIQDITSKFLHQHTISWSKLVTYNAIRKIDKSSHFFILVEYQYMGELGTLLLHENIDLPIPFYDKKIQHKSNDRVRLISATLKITNSDIVLEEDVLEYFLKFEGIYKNYHQDVTRFYLYDFLLYLSSMNKINIQDISNTSLEISDYQLNDFLFHSQDMITFSSQ